MRVVLDTNVLVRAIGRATSPAREVFLRLLDPPHALVASAFMLNELRRVLSYPRIQAAHGLSEQSTDQFLRDIVASAEIIDPPESILPVVLHDPDDDPIVATAVFGRADVLCTRDRHLRRDDVVAYCGQFSIRVLDELELLAELRELDSQ